MEQKQMPVSRNLEENIRVYKQIFADCADIKMREMKLGKKPEEKLNQLSGEGTADGKQK